jgi:hypothetical protein
VSVLVELTDVSGFGGSILSPEFFNENQLTVQG